MGTVGDAPAPPRDRPEPGGREGRLEQYALVGAMLKGMKGVPLPIDGRWDNQCAWGSGQRGRTMSSTSESAAALQQQVTSAGQQQVLRFYDQLDPASQAKLSGQLGALDLGL